MIIQPYQAGSRPICLPVAGCEYIYLSQIQFLPFAPEDVMQKTWNSALWLLVAAVFASVLFADFLSLPFGGYASQRFILVGLLGLAVSCSVVVLVYQHGWALFGRIWPAVLVAGVCSVLSWFRAGGQFAGK